MTPFQKLVRLAYTHPELRAALVPVLRRHRTACDAQEPKIDHGYDQPLAGGTDVMKRLQDQLLIEQGREPREPNPRLASGRKVASQIQHRLIQALQHSPELRKAVQDAVKRYAADTGKTVVINAAVEDIMNMAVAVALDPDSTTAILAKHTTRE